MSFSAAYRSQNTGKTMMFTHQQMFPYWYLSYKSRPKGQQISHSVHDLINRIGVRKYNIHTKRNTSVEICPYGV